MSDFTTHFVSAHRFLEKGEFSDNFKTAFYYGVQGPDLFFYYKPIKNRDGVRFGGSLHDRSPKMLFEKDILELDGKSDFYRGYYFGVMLHFFGDEMMHQYIGYLLRFDKTKHAHEKYERDIDFYAYQDEFKDIVKNFKVREFYKYSDDLAKQIYDFWHERDGREFIKEKTVKVAMKTIVRMAQWFSTSNKFVVWLLSKLDRKEGVTLAHFKFTKNYDVMNADHNQWKSPEGVVDYSVYEIIDIAILNFSKEFKKINKAIANSDTTYKFTNEHTFSYGCEKIKEKKQ
ncbi:MAG: zinc dependent phospholipase C family protein [Clostridia bacterium]